MPGTKIVFSVVESPEGGYEARAVGHSIFTQAETIEELHTMIRDAIFCHFDAEIPYAITAVEGPASSI